MFDLTFEAFDLADKYRNPVIVFADAILGQMKESAILEPVREPMKVEKEYILDGAKGRPVRNIRSMYLEGDDQEELNYTLQEKYDRVRRDEQRSEEQWTEDADCVIVAFGTSSRIALSAARQAREEGLRVGIFRPISLFPFPVDALRALSERVKRMLVVEMNLGQMVDDVRGRRSSMTLPWRSTDGPAAVCPHPRKSWPS